MPPLFLISAEFIARPLRPALDLGYNPSRTSIQEAEPMPVYEYSCKDCHSSFDKTLTLAAHDREPVTCPKCGGKNVAQEVTRFYAVTSRKSA